jgi:hypothetical protein
LVNSASGSNDKPRDIVKKCYTGLTEEEIATSKSRSALSQKVRRIRRRKLGDEVVANEVSEIVITVNQRYTIVRDDQEYDEMEPFYFEDTQLETPFRVIIFTTSRNLKLMERHRDWYGDGTFDVAPRLMKQLYTLLIIIQNKCLPMLYAYLPDKKYETYLILFKLIKKNIDIDPKSISVDFEKAVFNEYIMNKIYFDLHIF